jgi:hypothetical protein
MYVCIPAWHWHTYVDYAMFITGGAVKEPCAGGGGVGGRTLYTHHLIGRWLCRSTSNLIASNDANPWGDSRGMRLLRGREGAMGGVH